MRKKKDFENGEGVFVTGPGVALDKGDYHLTVSYAASSEGNYISFESNINPDTVEGINEPNMLPAAETWGAHIIPLHIEEYTESLDFTMYYGGTGSIRLFDIAVDGEDFRPGDVLVTGFLVLLFYILAGLVFLRGGREKFSVFAILLLTAVISSYPYFSKILFFDTTYNGNDMPFHLLRIVGIRDGFLSGQFPVRIYPTAFYGTGYDASLYYPDLFLYFPAVLCLMGVSIVTAVQIFGFLIQVA